MRSDNKNTESKPIQELKEGLGPDEGALSRWSRRKQDALKESEQELPAAPAVDEAEPDQPLLTDADMPSVEDLSEDSDYSGFLSPGVSEELRALALRKFFRSAKFNIVDGLDDYDDDFRAVTLLKDVLVADATDKIKEATKHTSEDEQSAQAQQETAAQSDEQTASKDAVEDEAEGVQAKAAKLKNEQNSENNDEIETDGERGAE